MEKRKNLHLLWRSGFGPTVSGIKEAEKLKPAQIWNKIKKQASNPLPPIKPNSTFVQDNYGKPLDANATPEMRTEFNRKIRAQSNQDIRDMNISWMNLMARSENQLGEKMSFFWHNHFAIRHASSYLQHEALNVIRKHALGNFGDLLREVSKSAAMILSLNNQQNRRSSPNENFAREVMELFSMGIGNYTEQDIKEAARAFTGWSVTNTGQFVFRAQVHDAKTKTILGNTGNYTGDDVIDIILKQEQTATFIATKVYQFFVNDNIDKQRIQTLANNFRKDYNILGLVDAIFKSDWFYQESNYAVKVKSPVELMVGLRRLSPYISLDKSLEASTQRLLGQNLFNPPSIAGWPSGRGWMDSSTLMVRLQLPSVAYGKMEISLKAKTDDDMDMGRVDQKEITLKSKQDTPLNPQWESWIASRTEDQLQSDLLQSNLSTHQKQLLKEKTTGQSKTNYALALMGLPEYQLC